MIIMLRADVLKAALTYLRARSWRFFTNGAYGESAIACQAYRVFIFSIVQKFIRIILQLLMAR